MSNTAIKTNTVYIPNATFKPNARYRVVAIIKENKNSNVTKLRILDKNFNNKYPVFYQDGQFKLRTDFIKDIPIDKIDEIAVRNVENLMYYNGNLYLVNCNNKPHDINSIDYVKANILNIEIAYTNVDPQRTLLTWCKNNAAGRRIIEEYISSNENYVLPSEIYKSSKVYDYFRCLKCGRVSKQRVDNKTNGNAKCLYCNTSITERCIGLWLKKELKKYNINIEYNKNIDDGNFDITIRDLHLIIEIHNGFRCYDREEEKKKIAEDHKYKILHLNAELKKRDVEPKRQKAIKNNKPFELYFYYKEKNTRSVKKAVELLNDGAKEISKFIAKEKGIYLTNPIDEETYIEAYNLVRSK